MRPYLALIDLVPPPSSLIPRHLTVRLHVAEFKAPCSSISWTQYSEIYAYHRNCRSLKGKTTAKQTTATTQVDSCRQTRNAPHLLVCADRNAHYNSFRNRVPWT